MPLKCILHVSPEVAEETFFLFSSGESEPVCITSSPLDKPGVKRARKTLQCQQKLADYTRPLSTQQPANCKSLPSPCACSPAGLGVQVAGGSSVLDGSSLTEAHLQEGFPPSCVASAGQIVSRLLWNAINNVP